MRLRVPLAHLLLLILLGFPVAACSQTETVLYTFGNVPTDGYYPGGGLVMDAAGNLYGTTGAGGTAVLCPDPTGLNSCGTVFELANSSGSYQEVVLHNFTGPNSDGDEPNGNLVMDAAGNLYGTTMAGGYGPDCVIISCGMVFELVKTPEGYTEQVLYNFDGTDGAEPLGGLIMDASGNLYGATLQGGVNSHGTVFELVNSSGTYTHQILYSFGASERDGWYPKGELIMDAARNLYGITPGGGDPAYCNGFGCGTVYELVKSDTGYAHQILYSLDGTSAGGSPEAGLVVDKDGNLYGTANGGGEYNYGTVFELVNNSGIYTEKTLYSFKGASSNDGAAPAARLTIDSSGNVYGTTTQGGVGCSTSGCGTVFELVNSSGTYTEKVLHAFGASGDGSSPTSPVLVDSQGHLFGTTGNGGSQLSLGTVYEIDPLAPAPAVTLSSSNLSFGNQPLNTSSLAQSITITNVGKANLVFPTSAILSLGSPSGQEFAVNTDTCSGQSITANANCSVSVVFTPAYKGLQSAYLNISDNAPLGVQTVSLNGTGTLLSAAIYPQALTFGTPVVVGNSSVTLPVELTNTGNIPLAVSAISVSPNFTESDNCNGSIPAQMYCIINVAFVPTQGGPISGVLSITEAAASTPTPVALSGKGQDFTVAPASGSSPSATVSAGGSANYSLSITPQGGYNQVVALSCTGAPVLATCSVSPASISLDGEDSATIAVSVTTSSPSQAASNRAGVAVAALGFLPFGILVFTPHYARSANWRNTRRAWLLFALVIAVTLWTSCGGGSPASSSTRSLGTPPGTYTLTVKGTSGNLTNSCTLTLAVN